MLSTTFLNQCLFFGLQNTLNDDFIKIGLNMAVLTYTKLYQNFKIYNNRLEFFIALDKYYIQKFYEFHSELLFFEIDNFIIVFKLKLFTKHYPSNVQICLSSSTAFSFFTFDFLMD